jgi:hypothetical protein
MGGTEPAPAPNAYTLRRLLKTYIKVVAVSAVIGILGLTVVLGVYYYASYLSPGLRAQPYVQAVDRLDLPSNWEVARTTVKQTGYVGGCGRMLDPYCPSVTRYFWANAPLGDVWQETRALLADAGYEVDEDDEVACLRALLANRSCSMTLIVDPNTRLDLTLYRPGDGDVPDLIRPDRALVRLTAWPGI